MPMLNYRVFEACLRLQSFRNEQINKFDARDLMEQLSLDSTERGLLEHNQAIGFHNMIEVTDSQSKYINGDRRQWKVKSHS